MVASTGKKITTNTTKTAKSTSASICVKALVGLSARGVFIGAIKLGLAKLGKAPKGFCAIWEAANVLSPTVIAAQRNAFEKCDKAQERRLCEAAPDFNSILPLQSRD